MHVKVDFDPTSQADELSPELDVLVAQLMTGHGGLPTSFPNICC